MSGLYLIIDRKISGIEYEEMLDMALKGGVRIIQLREKEMSKKELLRVVSRLKEKTKICGATLIINDYIDIAEASDADGVHLGQDDLPLGAARRILGPDKIIGISTHDINQALEAQSQGADYIGLGPIFHTETKKTGRPCLGTETVRDIKKKIHIPLVAIGGINLRNLGEVMAAGADAVAVISAITKSRDITEEVKKFIGEIEKIKLKTKIKTETEKTMPES